MDSLLYKLQKFDPGMVWLNNDNIITALNHVAMKTLGDNTGELIGQEILQLHPQRSREKVSLLLSESSCPVESAIPMTMMINIPERVLLIKVAKMLGEGGQQGTCMIFYDLTDMTSVPEEEKTAEASQSSNSTTRRLIKLPVYKNNQILLVDLNTVGCIQANGHYSTLHTREDEYLCNLSLVDLADRLDSKTFLRTHRSYIVNLNFAKALRKQDSQWQLVMECETEQIVPISRNKIPVVKEHLGLN